MVSEGIPLEQGLRQVSLAIIIVTVKSSEGIPLEQEP